MAWISTHRYASISPRKARLVVDLIRGRRVDEADVILQFTNKRAAGFIRQVLRTAVANADEKEADVESLYVSEARIDEGPSQERFQPKDRGRAFPIEKKTSHIIVAVEQGKRSARKAQRGAE